MTLKDMRIAITVDASGDLVTYGEKSIFGRLIAVLYDRGDMDTGTDLTLTWDSYPVTETILTITNAGTADKIWYPRRLLQGETGSDLTGTSGGDREPFIIMGRPKLTVDEGGASKSGALILVYEE